MKKKSARKSTLSEWDSSFQRSWLGENTPEEQNVLVSNGSYTNSDGVDQYVLWDPVKKWDVCRGSEDEINLIFRRYVCPVCWKAEPVAGHDFKCVKCWTEEHLK